MAENKVTSKYASSKMASNGVVRGKRIGETLAFVHFALTEMRPIWLLWYTVFSTVESIVTSTAILDVYDKSSVRICLFDGKIDSRGVQECMQRAYKRYFLHGESIYKHCTAECPESDVQITAAEPRIIVFVLTAWLFGFLLALLVYCVYRRPNYYTGSYITFTQTLYASKAYKVGANLTFAIFCAFIPLGIYILNRERKSGSGIILAIILLVISSRSLVLEKSNGVLINSKVFCRLEISRGNALMNVLNFVLTTNAVLLDEMEVQLMQKGFPDHVAASGDKTKGCMAYFDWFPLSDKSINEYLAIEVENVVEETADIASIVDNAVV